MDWVEEFSVYLSAQIEGRPVPAPVAVVVLPQEDAPDEEAEYIGPAEGQFFMIDYRDARGQVSTRRITVRTVRRGAEGSTILHSFCHERQAMRPFRADRISACYDYDGVVRDDVAVFLEEALGIPPSATEHVAPPRRSPAKPPRPEKPPKQHVSWNDLRRIVRQHAVLFSALSHSDGVMLDAELRIALAHCDEVARAHGHETTEAETGALEAYIRRLRPTPEAIGEACAVIFLSGKGDAAGFLLAASALIDADGERHPEEERLLREISADLMRRGVLA